MNLRERAARLEHRLLGIEPEDLPADAAVASLMESERRRRGMWTIPVIAFIALTALRLYHWQFFGWDSAGWGMMFRIFVFDYLIFLIAGLSGWNMASRWRRNAEQVEELSLAPMPPAATGRLLSAGSVSVWARALIVFGLVDLVMPVQHLQYLGHLRDNAPSQPGAVFVMSVITFITMIALPVFLTWFHIESARLAHWLFAVHALPRQSLAQAGIANFFLTSLYVAALSALGSAVTGTALVIVWLLTLIVTLQGDVAGFGLTYTGWAFASLAGLAVVALAKRQISITYETSFGRRWLMYQWWGAGERRQPQNYPLRWRQDATLWELYSRAREEQEAGVPEDKRRFTQRYRRLIAMEEARKIREEARLRQANAAGTRREDPRCQIANEPPPPPPPEARRLGPPQAQQPPAAAAEPARKAE